MSAKWEIFCDPGYYDMWAVRPISERNFNSPQLFHFANLGDAEAFMALAEKAVIAVRKQGSSP